MSQFLRLGDHWVNTDQIREVVVERALEGGVKQCQLWVVGETKGEMRAYTGEDAAALVRFLEAHSALT